METIQQGIRRSERHARQARARLKVKLYTALTLEACAEISELRARPEAPKGTGTRVMQEICALADSHGLTLTLEPNRWENEGGNGWKPTDSIARLKTFYRRFGFLPNTVRHGSAQHLRGTMHRRPAGKTPGQTRTP